MACRYSTDSFPGYGSPARELPEETHFAEVQRCRTAHLGYRHASAVRNRIEKIAFEKNHHQRARGDFFNLGLCRAYRHAGSTVAWGTGLRAGELLALTTADLDFTRKTISVNKSSDHYTREVRQPKTPTSVADAVGVESTLRNYLTRHWQSNAPGLLFPNRRGTRPRLRDNVVRYGLKPVLRKLGIPAREVGLHAFRHGLATELANAGTPIPTLQQQMRHADVRTTLEVYAHVLPDSQRQAVEGAAISTVVPISTIKPRQPV